MNIKIWNDKYVIKSDPRQYKLIEIKEKPSEEDALDTGVSEDGTYEVIIGYYNSMTSVFKSIVEREGRLNKCTTLEGYVKHIEKINKKLEENLLAMATIIGKKESFKRVMMAMPDQIPECIATLGEEKKSVKKSVKKK